MGKKNEPKQEPVPQAPVEPKTESIVEKIQHAASDLIDQVTGHKSEEAPVEVKADEAAAGEDETVFQTSAKKKIKPVPGADFEGHPKLNKFK